MTPAGRKSLLLPGVAVVLAAAAIFLSAFLFARVQAVFDKLAMESKGRRDQACLRDETAHKRDVRQLRQTYKFLAAPPPSLRDLVPLIVAQLPRTEQEAEDKAPAFCDEPGIGLPEPDPVIPRRPRALSLPN